MPIMSYDQFISSPIKAAQKPN